jgi:stage II sporulation protein D
VRIFKGKSRVTVDSESAVTTIPALAAGGGLDLAARAGTVSVNGGPGIRELKIASATPLRLQAGSAVRHYRGSLVVTAEGNTLQLINHVGIEDYLYGVVTKESVASWPNEALKTQAVASRTYALYQAQHRKSRAWDMVDDEGSQVYGGVEGESAAAHRAVDETRGIVVTYKGRPIYAMFTSNTGWHTGDPKFIFDQPLAYLTAVPDPYSPNQQLGRWKRSHGAAEVRSRLAAIGVKLGTIRAIEPRLTDPSGRIVRVAIVDERGAHEMRTRPTLARALALPEILLDVQREGDGFVFAGGGFGHGVGLSQWGAKDMADKGFGVREILAFYYRNTEIGVADP